VNYYTLPEHFERLLIEFLITEEEKWPKTGKVRFVLAAMTRNKKL